MNLFITHKSCCAGGEVKAAFSQGTWKINLSLSLRHSLAAKHRGAWPPGTWCRQRRRQWCRQLHRQRCRQGWLQLLALGNPLGKVQGEAALNVSLFGLEKKKTSCECNTWLLSHRGVSTMATCATTKNWEAREAEHGFHTRQGRKNDSTASWCIITVPCPPYWLTWKDMQTGFFSFDSLRLYILPFKLKFLHLYMCMCVIK